MGAPTPYAHPRTHSGNISTRNPNQSCSVGANATSPLSRRNRPVNAIAANTGLDTP
jgi:hypothetical protein